MTMSTNPLTNSATNDWTYHAQGGANIVLRYNKQSAPCRYDGKLLRLRKVNAHRSSAELSQDDEDELEMGFGTEVIAPLLGSEYVLPVESYAAQSDWLDELRELLSRDEAATGDHSTGAEVDLAANHVQLVDNLTHGEHTLSIEIKPKWGFLPSPPPSQSPSTPTACRFCKHSLLRRRHLAPPARHSAHQANYCPLDLYSRSLERVARAVRALVSAWHASGGQQNNLHVFWGGKKVAPGDTNTLDDIDNALRTTIWPATHPTTSHTASLESQICSALLPSVLLPRLAHLQSSLAPLTITALHPLLPSPLPPQPTLPDWTSFLARQASAPLTATSPVGDQLLGHSLSATFKDCSIFLRATQETPGGEWRTDLKVIDLDPKPVGKVHKWAALEREVDVAWARDAGEWRAAGWEVRECYV